MKKTLLTGMAVGILAGMAALLTEYVVGMTTDLWFEELSPVSILLSCILTNVVGAVIFQKLDQKTTKAKLYYGFVVGAVTLLTTLNTIFNPPQEQFGVAGHPVHIIVALLSIWLVPRWMKKNTSIPQENPTAKAN
ncbi:hypothetical protein [Thalassobacillus pellis]|uniref:hypothetical protein n=1 Tax=Thalassobacillus pellis TaxID=748008 RepID=UPI001962098E|nr:hypothetical protein [Thalassobacillus pellis]MBM7554512.1 asparagine N-glycosylation enzyme membrane subunit Stt3 [Thalassobacillus pellis]